MPPKQIFEIDGSRFTTLDGFFDEISRELIPGADWGHNLDAFNDILRGGFGTPDEGFVIRWKNSAVSRERLGYPETVRQLERNLKTCDPLNRTRLEQYLANARESKGTTIFEQLLEIVSVHTKGGREENDGVELLLD